MEKYLTSNIFELLNPVREGNDLSWADKGEVEGVEVDNNILASIVRKRHLCLKFEYTMCCPYKLISMGFGFL